MARGPLPGETRFAWPRSNSVRDLLRFVTWLAAVVWFLSPPAILLRLSVPVVVAIAGSLLVWAGGFILLGRLARGLAPDSEP